MSFSKIFHILFLILIISTNIMTQTNAANCEQPACPFKINLKDLEPLTHNHNILSYKIQEIDKKNVKVTGRLHDNNQFEILLHAGDSWNRTHRKIMSNTQSKPLSDKQYWLDQALLFAKEIWQYDRYFQVKNDLAKHQFSTVKNGKSGVLRFEKYNEGNFISIDIFKSNNKTIIVLQQSAC